MLAAVVYVRESCDKPVEEQRHAPFARRERAGSAIAVRPLGSSGAGERASNRSFPQSSGARSTASWLSRVDSIQRYLGFEDGVRQHRMICLRRLTRDFARHGDQPSWLWRFTSLLRPTFRDA
jgi:hypothetical protein